MEGSTSELSSSGGSAAIGGMFVGGAKAVVGSRALTVGGPEGTCGWDCGALKELKRATGGRGGGGPYEVCVCGSLLLDGLLLDGES